MTAEGTGLTRFQRILVRTDGTVTQLLEVYAGEPIEVVKLAQAIDTSDENDVGLDLSVGDKVLRRKVILRSARTCRNLLHAESVVVVDRVDPCLVDGLLRTNTPLGRLLVECRTETFRQVLHVGTEPAGTVGSHFGIELSAHVIVRTYRIVARRRPVALVMERFPTVFFRELTG